MPSVILLNVVTISVVAPTTYAYGISGSGVIFWVGEGDKKKRKKGRNGLYIILKVVMLSIIMQDNIVLYAIMPSVW